MKMLMNSAEWVTVLNFGAKICEGTPRPYRTTRRCWRHILEMSNNEIMLSVDDIYVSYGHVEALKGVNLEVKKGEIVVLVGANGAGKTSIMETILGVNQAVKGRVFSRTAMLQISLQIRL